MADATRGKERIKFLTINHDREDRGGKTGHDKFNPIIWKVKLFEDMVNEVPFESVKSFFKINFEGHKALLAFGDGHGMNNFLS